MKEKRPKVIISAPSKKRRAARRRKRALRVFAFLIVFAVCVFAVLSVTVLFPVTKVVMKNQSRYTGKEIRTACAVSSKDNMILLSEKTVRDRAYSKIPYADISLSKKLPDTVILKIKDAVPAYYLVNGAKKMSLTSDMRVIEETQTVPTGTVTLKIKDKITAKPGSIISLPQDTKDLIDNINKSVLGENVSVSGIDVSSALDIKVIVNNRLLVLLGSDVDMEYKVKHFKAMLPSIDENSEGIINLKNWTDENSKATFRDVKVNFADFCELSQ